jgi:hypothetical protein
MDVVVMMMSLEVHLCSMLRFCTKGFILVAQGMGSSADARFSFSSYVTHTMLELSRGAMKSKNQWKQFEALAS